MIAQRFALRERLDHAIYAAILGLAVGCTVVSAPVFADESIENAHQQQWSIATGPLSTALDQYARQGGISLSYNEAELEGKATQGISGAFDSTQALAMILQGTGLQSRQLGGNSFLIVPAVDAGGVMELGATSVTSMGLGTVTENTGSYTTGAVTIGKTAQSLRHTPQSVTVLTQQRLADQNLNNLTEVLEQTPGIVVDYTDSERVAYYSRGFSLDAIQYDGATVVQGSGGGSYIQSDSAIVDHMEVLRGATGMLRGSGNPSGTVNIVRKRPTRDFQASGSYTAGSWDAQRYVADISGPLSENGDIRGRVIAVHDDKDFFQDSRMERKNVFYASLAADITDRTTFTGGIEYTDLDATGSWGGLPADFDGKPLDLPRDTYLGASWNRWDRSNIQTFGEIEHLFDNDWRLKLMATHTSFKLDDNGFKQTYISRTSTTNPYLMNVSVTEGDGGESEQTNYSLVADGPFSLFGREHQLVLGAERVRNDSYASATRAVPQLTNIDIRNWDPGSSLAEPDINITARPILTRTTQEGAYATWRISLADPLTAVIGARMSWWDSEQRGNPDAAYSVNQEITPYAALIYDLNENFSLYGSYTEIFNPQNVTDASGSLLDPVTGEAYEIGLKGEFYDGRLNSSFALFRINQVGKALDDISGPASCPPSNPDDYCQVAGGKSRSEGFELELSGEVLPDWQVGGGYTYTTTEYLKDTVSNTGNVLRSTDPKRMLKLFTSYRLPGELSAWKVGAGVRAQSDIYSRSGQMEASQSGYAVYNAMVDYRFDDNYSVQLNANNLFDKHYYKKIGTTFTSYYYGDPRNFSVTLRGTF
jgi:outer membrane receptor for ferric coprogen and ferric-rhodotorulic acid